MKNIEVFELAHLQLEREDKTDSGHYLSLLFDRAVTIRHWLDIQERNTKIAQERYKKLVIV